MLSVDPLRPPNPPSPTPYPRRSLPCTGTYTTQERPSTVGDESLSLWLWPFVRHSGEGFYLWRVRELGGASLRSLRKSHCFCRPPRKTRREVINRIPYYN